MQIPGFGERPEEWIIDSIIAHNGKGTNSEFLILWKASDKTWATYREVAHLIALDRYCELMGVDRPSELPSNYVRDYPEDEDLGGEGLLVNHYFIWTSEWDRMVGKRYIKEGERVIDDSKLTMVASPASSVFDLFTCAEYDACISYKAHLDSFIRGGGPPVLDYPPPCYEEFIQYNSEPHTATSNTVYHTSYNMYPSTYPSFGGYQMPINYPQMGPETVSMPARSLDTIVRLVGDRHETQCQAPRVIKYINYGGKGSKRGRGAHARAGYRGHAGRGG